MTLPNQVTNPAPSTPPATAVVGDPFSQPMAAPALAAVPVATAAPMPPAVAPQPVVIIGDRSFKSQNEADQYLRSLEVRTMPPANHTPTATAPVEVDPAALIFEDPTAAFKLVEERVMGKIQARESQQKQGEQNWAKFYQENPDLQEHRDVVEMQMQRNWGAIKDLHITQSLPILANESRAFLSRIRGSANTGERLPSGPAVVAGSSGATPPSAPAPTQTTTSFVDELKAMRTARAKS